MAKSLQYVHQKGFIHRDVCPRNFICSTDYKTVKLIDFGLTVPAQPPFMQPGNRTGTPLYMAPEIVRRRETDKRVDIFAFGVTAYHICTYKLPWATKDTSGMAALSHDTVKPTPITEYCPTIAPELATLIHKCFSVDPDQRPNSFESVLTALRRIQQTAN
ncbi:MAG: protein kinase [Pirellulaceae bacterium]|nr:protein kinase [Pirellulaceae bacterium]